MDAGIIFRDSLEFFGPRKLCRELNMLVLIGDNPLVSQHVLAREIGITPTMVNNYMKYLTDKNMVSVEGKTNRQTKYFLTPKGKRRRRMLLNKYITEVSGLYSACKMEFRRRLNEFHRNGIKRVIFFGAAETGEIAYQAASTTALEIVGIVDNDPNKHHKKLGDIEIRPPSCIEELSPDGVIITALAHPGEIYQQLLPLKEKGIVIKKL